MAEKKLVDQLFRRLTEEALDALDGAVQQCKVRGHRYVELAHWLHNLVQLPNSDLHRIVAYFQIAPSLLHQQINEAVDAMTGGYRSAPIVAGSVRKLIHDAWVQASARFDDHRIRSGHLVLAALNDPDLSELLLQIAPVVEGVSIEALSTKFDEVTAGSPEASPVGAATDGPESGLTSRSESKVAKAGATGPRTDALARFTEDLTLKAREGRIDPVVGRDDEIRQVIDILMRRRQNNPILTGEAGVGKTAVVEGFALRIAAGDVPPLLRGVSLRSLDLALMQAGASVRGEFENRLKQLIDEVKSSGNTILFIDEAHTLIGAGGGAGQGDAANLLKPALARGELRTVAATTADEYRKYIESDPALKRRFQEVMVNEPSEEKTIRMLRSLTKVLEKHHGVVVFEDAVAAAATLSGRYIPARQLPDKAVAVLDTACARVAFSQHGTPGPVEDLRRHIQGLKSELENLGREQNLGANHDDRSRKTNEELGLAETSLKSLEARWEEEKKIVAEIDAARKGLDRAASSADAAAQKKLQGELRGAEARLATLQGETPLVRPRVDAHVVGSVIADWTGIPVGRMVKNEIHAALNLPQLLGSRVVGQDHALELIARHIRTAQAQLKEPNKPLGSFLLIGPSGSGKTETALALAEARYGSERNLVVFNMNEFKEEHTVSSLLGAPPGYKGYEKGGLLTEAIRRRPYSVVLLDEFEKAHDNIQEVFLQVLDQGWTKDREGRYIDFRNAILILTTNAASDRMLELYEDPTLRPTKIEKVVDSIRPQLRDHFSDPLLGRLVLIPYFPLSPEVLASITDLKLKKIQRRLKQVHDVELVWHETVRAQIVQQCSARETGGRMIDAIVTNTLLPEISREVLSRLLGDTRMASITVRFTNNEFAYEFAERERVATSP